jgi:hypothetical protein
MPWPAASPICWPTIFTTSGATCPTSTRPTTPRFAADLEARRARPWLTSRPLEDLAGVYDNPDLGRMEIAVRDGAVSVRIGVLSAEAEAFTQPDSLRVELIPLQGQVIVFDGPDRLTYDGFEFVRVPQ